ncbi:MULTISPECIES: hypothetical protein [unclassified Chelatococcus]|uniref:hypothetical protein n=1 Tax=unclassified Chelatococcus TaxID=2638111 RepID=UPI001BCB1ACD|nr:MULTISPECIES: hypothetical protein [unclassified Chelatococcus]MBS7696192.1 hypothetical protein [Chelatococcus sp. YT9]MBX3557781.1 hypothetical protein [Chelatococcus sp.]
MVGDGKRLGGEKPANDNRTPRGQETVSESDISGRLNTVVLSIARLIGRRMAREDHEKAVHAANDNAPPEAGDNDG